MLKVLALLYIWQGCQECQLFLLGSLPLLAAFPWQPSFWGHPVDFAAPLATFLALRPRTLRPMPAPCT
jgi:hypothetical protein